MLLSSIRKTKICQRDSNYDASLIIGKPKEPQAIYKFGFKVRGGVWRFRMGFEVWLGVWFEGGLCNWKTNGNLSNWWGLG